MPPAARTRSWLTLERNGQLFVWHDPEGNPPPDEVTIPRIDGAYSADWTAWTWDSILVDGANCREVVDNVVDMAHFFYIHFAFPTYFKNVLEGHVASQYLRTRSRPDVGGASNYAAGGESTLRSEASYFGPSYMIDNLRQDYQGMTVESVLINCHYPVTPNSFMLQWGVIVRRPPGLTDGQAARFGAKFAKFVGIGFEQDVAIWLHKSRIDNPLLCAEDGPVYQLRRWYDQFYTDVADIEPDMVARYEFEIDTSQAGGGLGGGGRGEPGRAAGGGRCLELTSAGRSAAAGAVRSVRCGRAGREVQPAAHVGAVDRGVGGVLREFARGPRPAAGASGSGADRGLRRAAGQHRRRGGGRDAGGLPAVV